MSGAGRGLPQLAFAHAGTCAALIGLAFAAPASAKILKTRQSSAGHRALALTVGSGFVYETDGEESEYGFPFLVEYGLTDVFEVSAEPSWILVRKETGATVRGPGDLETTLPCELPTERRYRPGLAFEAVVKWPTAPRGDLVEAEAVAAIGAGGHFRGHSGSLGGFANIGGPEQGQSESEGTLGVAEHVGEFLKFEQGVVLRSDGTWEFVLAWEYDFSTGRWLRSRVGHRYVL